MTTTTNLNTTKLNDTITKISVDVHILTTTLNYGENSEFIILDCLERILSLIIMIKQPYELLHKHAAMFDCCPEIKQNGFRSLCYLTDKCIDLTILEINKFKTKKKSFFFNYLYYEQKFQNIRDLLCTIYFMLKFGEKIITSKIINENNSTNDNITIEEGVGGIVDENLTNSLFVNINDPINKIMYDSDLFTDKAFYGNFLGFYYMDSIRMPLTNIANAMAGFADALDRTSNKFGRAVTALAFSSMYSNNHEKRSQRLKTLLTNPSIEFIKSFWSLSEDYNLTVFTDLMGPSISIDKSFHISTADYIDIQVVDTNCNDYFNLKPLQHKPFINARLYSSKLRIGQKSLKDGDKFVLDNYFHHEIEPNSDYILFHCPGGGFLAQSPKSHGIYLKMWTKKLNIPIISIDYSKAPQSPFPSAVDECFYAYCWMLKNHNMLGSNATKIGIIGDSAGGNLIYGVVNKAIEAGIRVPDFIVAIYPVFCLLPIITPSRILSTCDLLLSTEVLKLCLISYISDDYHNLSDYIYTDQDLSTTAEADCKIPRNDSVTSHHHIIYPTNNIKPTADMPIEQHEKLRSTFSEQKYLNRENSKPRRIRRYHSRMNETFLKNEKITTSFLTSPNSSYSMDNFKSFVNANVTQSSSDMEMSDLLLKNGWSEEKKEICCHHYISPLFTPEYLIKKFPKSYIFVSNTDPLLDDSIEFTKKLKFYNAPVELNVVEGLPHGFVQFRLVSSDASNVVEAILNSIQSEFGIDCV